MYSEITQLIEPKSFHELVFESDTTREKLLKYADGKMQDNLVLHGPYGSSKSTIARIIAASEMKRSKSSYDTKVVVLNGASFGADSIKEIENDWNLHQEHFTYAIIDEFDILTSMQQADIRFLMDRHGGTKGLILTTNKLHKVEDHLLSRCDVVEIASPKHQTMLPICQKILSLKGLSLTDEEILDAVRHEPDDLRKVIRQINSIQS